MPTKKKSTTASGRFTASLGSVFEDGVLYAVIPGGCPAEAAHARARWVADVLSAARPGARGVKAAAGGRHYAIGEYVFERGSEFNRAILRGLNWDEDGNPLGLDAVADALNAAAYYPWNGDGPTREEVGEDIILAWDGRGWNYAVWEFFEDDPSTWWWRDIDQPVLNSATHWRRALKPPVAVSSER